MESPQSQLKGDEPPMFIQRPSSAKSQDVSHILARTFREYFTRDAVAPDTVKYLNTSKGGDDQYHEGYVEALRKVQEEREKRMATAAMLETHIMQAQARAMSATERELNRARSQTSSFPDIGLPPSRSYYRSCIDSTLLQKHNLITPDDYYRGEAPIVPAPSEPIIPSYARETMSSAKRNEDGAWESPFPSPRDSQRTEHRCSDDAESMTDRSNPLPPIPSKNLETVLCNQISAEDREYNRQELANQQAKVNYLKNPRHIPPSAAGAPKPLTKPIKKRPKEVGIKPPAEKESPKEPAVVFLPCPNVLTFKNYTIGTVYEMALELKNMTSVLRPVRVIPPKTQFFSVSLGQFPGEQGLVAPGMSCRYMIRFSPDSVGDYDDLITIQSQASTPLTVRLEGRRPPPKLTLPTKIDVGQCLVGGVKICQFHVKNEGGAGKFCLMNRQLWPTTNLKSAIGMGTVLIPPFEIRPPLFELRAGESMVVEVLFAPTETRQYDVTMTSVCDNCHVKHFTLTGEGQTAEVKLVQIGSGLSEALPGEITDLTAQHLIRFENLNPFTYVQTTVVVQNLTNVELPYDWIIVKPYMVAVDPECPDTPEPPQERVQDQDSMFTIEPESGFLKPSAMSTFMLTFAPSQVDNFHNAFHLVLRNIPQKPPTPSVAHSEEGDVTFIEGPSHLESGKSHEEGVLSRQNSKVDSLEGALSRQSTLVSRQGTTVNKQNLRKLDAPIAVEPVLEDITALEFEAKGVCEPLSVVLKPYAITVPGKTMVETLVKRHFRMVNNSLSAILFQWEHHSSGYILEVEPPIGELAPDCEADLELSISGSEPCKIDHTLHCYVHHLSEPLILHIQAEIMGPEITIEEADVNFGLVRFGDTVRSSLTLLNNCRVPAKWSIRESLSHMSQSKDSLDDESEFTFTPESGELRPLESISVLVTFTPLRQRSLRTIFEVQVEDNNENFVRVYGEIMSPQACLLSCELSMANVFLNVPVTHTVTLINQTLLATSFQWRAVTGQDADKCNVSIYPAAGDLRPREKLDLELTFTANQVGELSDLILACEVAGMDDPLYLTMSTDVKGLSVTYSTPSSKLTKNSDDSNDLCLDFGRDLQIGQVIKRNVIISNHSAISAAFSLNVEYFTTKPPSPPETKSDAASKSANRRGFLSHTPNLADPLSKSPSRAQTDFCKMMLREGKGAAFAVSPASGYLTPFADVVIEVTAFSELWGDYTDSLVCKVEDLEVVSIPIKMHVTGCPLVFQMMAAQPHVQAILRCGSYVSGVPPVVRPMRINNPTPADIRLDWQIFNAVDNDTRLLDMVIIYGKSFPLLDANGQQIEPADDDDATRTVTPAPPRPPTGYIPNSPDSTPAVSRQEARSYDNIQSLPGNSRPKVISVVLREHGGILAASPYKVEPAQTVIPHYGSSTVNVSFTPLASSDVNTEISCNGYALGYMSLEKNVDNIPGKVQRKQGYEVSPLRLEMTAQVKPALLTIECADEEGMVYRAAASDLLVNGEMQSELVKLNHTTLINNTKTNLVFKLMTSYPFCITQRNPQTHAITGKLLVTNENTLRPRENALVHVGFRLNFDLLHLYENGGAVEGVKVEVRKEETRVHFHHDLVVEFNNGSCQRVPLSATLVIPCLSLTKNELDFGTCFVGQQRELQLLLSNKSSSASMWKCVLERRSENCADGVMEILPSEGALDAYVTHVSDSKTLLQVFFTAKHSEAYEAVYVFHGSLGETPQRLVIKGEGSYDGKHEALINI